MTEQIKALRARGFRRAALDEDTGDILLSFIDQNGDEQWLQLPLDAAGALAAGLMSAAAEAAKRAGFRTPTDVEKTFQVGMSLRNYELGISPDKTHAILIMHTVSGLTFEFPLTPADLPGIRSGLRRVEGRLNQGKSQRPKRH